MKESYILLGCPFCGGKVQVSFGEITHVVSIACKACGVCMVAGQDTLEAVKKWNQRKPEMAKKNLSAFEEEK